MLVVHYTLCVWITFFGHSWRSEEKLAIFIIFKFPLFINHSFLEKVMYLHLIFHLLQRKSFNESYSLRRHIARPFRDTCYIYRLRSSFCFLINISYSISFLQAFKVTALFQSAFEATLLLKYSLPNAFHGNFTLCTFFNVIIYLLRLCLTLFPLTSFSFT